MSVTVTIVIPLYQKGSTIRRTIESTQQQSFRDFEILVVDDGSTDEGPDVVRTLARADSRIRLLSRVNRGPGAAKNTGLWHASGPLITFLDADDEWEPVFLEHAVHALEVHPECDVYASAFRISPSGIDRWDELRAHGVKEGVWRLTEDISDHELTLCLGVIHSCSSLFRTSVVRRFGGFYQENNCRFGEDVYLWLQLMLHCTFLRSFKISACYHTEASELGLNSRRRDLPLEPVFTDPEPIRIDCPSTLCSVLERWLELHALRAMQMYAELRDRDKVLFLMKKYPRVLCHRREIMSIRLKLRAPKFHRSLRVLARAISATK